MKIGLIQTRGLGDIVIAAPIAMYYIERGCQVYWPIDSNFIPSFTDAFPEIEFLPVDKNITGDGSADYYYFNPLEQLKSKSCDSIICLYSHLTGFDFGQDRIKDALSFDAYKYAIAKVPFREKWNFSPRRNPIREANIFTQLGIDPKEKYNLIHNEGSNFQCNFSDHIKNKTIKNITISPITNNIFDWIGVIENSESIYVVDSVYLNLIEQLNITTEKSIYLRSKINFTPILQNTWTYV